MVKHTDTFGCLVAEKIGAKYHSSKEKGMMFRIVRVDVGDAKEYDVALLYYKPFHTMAEGYARLFTAAPALLAACKAVVAWYENSGSTDPCAGAVELWAAARKAVRKAEGES